MASEMTGIEITPLTAADLPRMMELERTSFSDPWSEEAMASTLALPVVTALGARQEGRLVGFVLAYVIPPEGEIADICVDASCRGQGIGSLLLQALMASACCNRYYLEVRDSNLPAQRLYRKMGFLTVGRRRGYYHNPREDAILMVWLPEGDRID